MCFQGFVAVAHMTGHVSRNFCFTIFQVTLDAFQGVAWLIWLNGRSGEPIDPVRMRVGEEKTNYPPGNLHVPQKWHFEDDFPFPKVGYVDPLEGTHVFFQKGEGDHRMLQDAVLKKQPYRFAFFQPRGL